MIKELSRQLDAGIRHYLFSLAQGCCFPCYSNNICLACKWKEFFPLKPGVHCRPKKICTSLVISIMGKANLFSTHDLQYITFLFLKAPAVGNVSQGDCEFSNISFETQNTKWIILTVVRGRASLKTPASRKSWRRQCNNTLRLDTDYKDLMYDSQTGLKL